MKDSYSMTDTSKIKILHVFHSFNMGGLENGVVNLINRSDPNLFEHEICCLTTTGSAEKRLERSVRIYQMHKREGNDWRMIQKFVKLIKASQPDIVHTRNWGSIDGILAARIAGIPGVIHGEHGWNMDDPYGLLLRRRIARRILFLGVDRFVAVSKDIRQWLHKTLCVRSSKIKTIINGVDTEKFFPMPKTDLRAEYEFEGSIVIGIVSRLDPIKRHDLLFQAFSKLDHKKYKLKLVVIGRGSENSKLQELAKKLPYSERIKFWGECEEVAKLYRLIDIFVLPSENEGISNTILEAMASGLPVIATKVGGNPELVQHEHTGLLIPPNDCDELVNALNFYIEKTPEMRKVHGSNARERAVSKFSLDRMIKQYETLYKSLYFNRQGRKRR